MSSFHSWVLTWKFLSKFSYLFSSSKKHCDCFGTNFLKDNLLRSDQNWFSYPVRRIGKCLPILSCLYAVSGLSPETWNNDIYNFVWKSKSNSLVTFWKMYSLKCQLSLSLRVSETVKFLKPRCNNLEGFVY